MRKIEIQLDSETFNPGESVEGYVIITCDNDFQCERIHISLKGTELARVVIHTGKVTIVHEEKREYIERHIELGENLVIPMGESRYDFSFTLPPDIPGSYVGSYGSIKFTLNAKAEISWARDLKSDVDLFVPFKPVSQTEPISNPKSGTIKIDGKPLLKIHIDEDHIGLGNPATFRFSVDRAAKIRGVRAEIIREEHVAPKGHKMDTKRTLEEEYFPDEGITRESWIESSLQTNSRWTPTFTSALIECRYLFKITLDIPRRLDSAIEIPITLVQSEIHKSSFDF